MTRVESPIEMELANKRRCAVIVAVAALVVANVLMPAVDGPRPVEAARPTAEGTVSSSSFGSSPAHPGGTVHAATASASATSFVVMVSDDVALTSIVSALELTGLRPTNSWHGALDGFSVDLDQAQRDTLAARSDVVSIEADKPFSIAATQTNPPWGLDRIDQRSLPLDHTFSPAVTGAGVTAYVLDSGLRMTHSEFMGRVARSSYWDFGDGTGASDCNGHGTHVTGILGGATFGVAEQVSIVPVKVLDCSGGGSTSSVVAGINWIINDHSGGPAVVNMSVGGPASAAVDSGVQAMVNDGITVVVAAGNSFDDSCAHSPSRVPSVITVAASEINDVAAPYSSFGSCVDILAPGTNILSSWATSDTATHVDTGTSMASPHVAGAAALILEQEPGDTPAQVWAALDAASTKGAIHPCCGDPDKLLYIQPVNSTVVLTVAGAGSGAGTVTSSPAGISCGAVCSASFAQGSDVSVTAAPSPGSSFSGWSGACSGTGGCDVTMTTAESVVATFTLVPVPAPEPVSMRVPAEFVATTPTRILDTRLSGGLLGPSSVTPVPVLAGSGISSGSAVALNVTVTDPTDAGYITVFPCGVARPTASDLNFTAGETIPNAVIAQVGDAGSVCVYASAETDLVIDVNGWFPAMDGFGPMSPVRLLDTRTDPGAGIRSGGSVTELPAVGIGGVPGSASAVVLNVTVTEGQAPGYVTVFPCGATRPVTSNVNFVAGETIANADIAAVGADGKVCLYTSVASQLIVDVNGWFSNGTGFGPLTPARLLDTRLAGGLVEPGTTTELAVAGRGGVPPDASAVALNVTVTQTQDAGYLTVYPCGSPPPTASNLNFSQSETIANTVLARVAADGGVCLYSSAATQLVVDVDGWFPHDP